MQQPEVSGPRSERGWHTFPRPKTANPWKRWLWTETRAAVRDAIAKRSSPKLIDLQDRVFVTKPDGIYVSERMQEHGKVVTKDCISQEFSKLLIAAKLHQAGLGFYSLRRTFDSG